MLSQEELLQKSLPKWPQMIVSGKSVTPDQASDIIFRTDSFLTDYCEWSGGNAKEFNNWYREIAGLNYLREKYEVNTIEGLRYIWDIHTQLRESLGYIKTEYVHNSWASCAFIFGPHGWCHPDGTIQYSDNIGKWPDIQEVLNEWNRIASAFPYLDLNVTLMNGEGCEDFICPVVNIRIVDGIATLQEPNLTVHSQIEDLVNDKSKLMDAAYKISYQDPVSRECGLSKSTYEQFAKIVHDEIKKLELEVC
jgi:hypothetical protein